MLAHKKYFLCANMVFVFRGGDFMFFKKINKLCLVPFFIVVSVYADPKQEAIKEVDIIRKVTFYSDGRPPEKVIEKKEIGKRVIQRTNKVCDVIESQVLGYQDLELYDGNKNKTVIQQPIIEVTKTPIFCKNLIK